MAAVDAMTLGEGPAGSGSFPRYRPQPHRRLDTSHLTGFAADAVGAGADERVLVLDKGNGARQLFDSKDAPVRSVVVGSIDDIVSGG
jgi:hypothetical protein